MQFHRIAANIVLLAGMLFSCSKPHPTSDLAYDPHNSLECPPESATDRYIEVPLFYDLVANGAHVDHIQNLNPNPHEDFLNDSLLKQAKVKLYYELAQPYDASKEILFLQAGGPGSDHSILHDMLKLSPDLTERFNLVAMDHRGIGCSRPVMPGDFPFQSLLMRYAASDIDAIRVALGGKSASINMFGVSYGTLVGQTYALLYPDHLKKLVLQSAYSQTSHFNIAQAKFENLAISTIPGQLERYNKIKKLQPDLAKRFILWSVRSMYKYKGRVKTVPERFNDFEAAIQAGDLMKAEELTPPERFVMPWMTRTIACVEAFPLNVLYKDEFKLFPFSFSTCSEFEDHYEYFNYTNSLKFISARTMIMGGMFDLVTPIEAMQEMSHHIPDNFFYMDMHLSHVLSEKNDCFSALLKSFLYDGTNEDLRGISVEAKCAMPPPVD